MPARNSSWDRRQFVSHLGAAAGGLACAPLWGGRCSSAADGERGESVAFFLIGDTHFLADKTIPRRMDARSTETTAGLIDTLNRLPGAAIPEAAGGGLVAAPRGVIHAGDVIDSGDKQGGDFPAMQETEWRAFSETCGLVGGDGRLKFPIYEVHGNHDSPTGGGLAISKIVERNKRRPQVGAVSPNGVHYSWDWGRVHFVNLGIVVGSDPALKQRGRYNPLDSLAFLVADLKEKVGSSGRPVVLTHHIDMIRYSTPCDLTAAAAGKEWHPCDVNAYFGALAGYNIAAILYGHTHVRNVFRWDGSARRGETNGLPVFNVDNGSHFSGPEQAFFYFEIGAKELVVREYGTKDRWQTGAWTPQVWRVPLV